MDENTKRAMMEFQEEFRQLSSQIPIRVPGVYEIEVAEVLIVGRYFLTPEEAIVRDTDGELWSIPEDRSGTKEELVSRWDVKPGMKLHLTIEPVVMTVGIGKVEVCE